MLDAVRELTSQRIFDEFPRLKDQNPSGDFWAPGYLVMTDSATLSEDRITDFIRNTRAWQGATKRE
jgi:REP element-mobilizing transposase RayT